MSKKIEICFPESRIDDFDLLSLPFKSNYRVLSWHGPGDGTILTPDFNILDVQGKIIVVKSFKVIPYYHAAAVDMFVDDGAGTVFQETIPATGRIDRIFDVFTNGTIVNLNINGGQVNLFNARFPLDIDLQNIYFKYPEKIQALSLAITSTIILNINTGATANPDLIVDMEVYLI